MQCLNLRGNLLHADSSEVVKSQRELLASVSIDASSELQERKEVKEGAV